MLMGLRLPTLMATANPADMDRDGDFDVVMALGFYYRPGSGDTDASQQPKDNQVVWYENNGKPAAGRWQKHLISPQFDDAFEAVARDLDGDGDIDVAATSWRNPGSVAWFENSGDPKASGQSTCSKPTGAARIKSSLLISTATVVPISPPARNTAATNFVGGATKGERPIEKPLMNAVYAKPTGLRSYGCRI